MMDIIKEIPTERLPQKYGRSRIDRSGRLANGWSTKKSKTTSLSFMTAPTNPTPATISFVNEQDFIKNKGYQPYHFIEDPYTWQEIHPKSKNDFDILLHEEIKKSRYILKLEDNWDDENSKGYNLENWNEAIQFVINFSKWINKNTTKQIQIPKIYHGPKGSIDLLWEKTDSKIYINIDKDKNLGTFYSFFNNSQNSGGEFELHNFDFKLLPLPLNI